MYLNSLTKNYLKKQVSGYVSKDQKRDDLNKYLRLDLGENLLGCTPKALEELKNISSADLNFYTDPSGTRLKQIISRLYGVKEQNVTLANSSNEIIDYLPKIIIEPKEKALVLTPTFFRFIESTLAAGGQLIYQNTKEERRFEYNHQLIEDVLKKINKLKAKLVWLCNPNNPTGTVLNLDLIRYLLRHTKALVILDEAFYEYFDLTNKYSGIKLINRHQNLIVLRTLSKAYGLAGLRFGYAFGHKKTIATIEKYRNTLLMTSSLVQKIAATALSDQQWLQKTVIQIRNLREKTFSVLKKQKYLNLAAESQINVYLLRHKTKDIYQGLKRKGILTADFRTAKGLEGKNYIRITVGKAKDNQTLLSVIKKYG